MSATSAIEWTDATWNPVTGCTKVSEGCDHCYAERLTERFHGPGSFAKVELHPERLDAPLRWRKPRRVFVNSMSDLFHDDVPDEFIAEVFTIMALAREHTFQILTKRPGRMAWLLNNVEGHDGGEGRPVFGYNEGSVVSAWLGVPPLPLPNVWLGTSVESQKWADVRIPKLLETPAAVRFLSCEPLLGPIDLSVYMGGICLGCGATVRTGFITEGMYIGGHLRPLSTEEALRVGYPEDPCGPVNWEGPNWVIVGGESGLGARPMHPDWARSLRDQCVAAGVPFFFKQWGEWAPHHDGIPFFKETQHRFNLEMRTLFADGSEYAPREPDGWLRPDKAQLWRIGKKRAGRELDGRTWDEMP